jgi:peptide/nickel transport system substrate-binding protein
VHRSTTQDAWRRPLALLVALLFVFAACGGGGSDNEDSAGGDAGTGTNNDDSGDEAAASEIVPGGSLTFGTESDVATLMPGDIAQPSDRVIGFGIYDPLMSFDEEGKLTPYLAESLTPSDDLLTWEMTLREGVVFHDGTPLNAESVTKHFDRLKDPATGCVCQGNVAIIESMDMPDGPTGLTVTFHLNSASVAFGELLGGASGLIESPTALAADPEGFPTHPVGTGPFTLAEFTPGERVVLRKFPDYWKSDDEGRQLPYLDELIVRPIPDSSQRLASLEAGDIQMFQTATSNVVVQAEEAGFAAQKISGSSSTIILMDESEPPFDDVRARQALAYAINKDALNERVYNGVREPSYSSFATDSPFFNPDAQSPGYDPDKAKALVDELGGLSFKLECIPTPEAQQLLELIQQMGEAVGMDIELATQEQGQYVNRIFSKSGDYDAACFRNNHFLEPDQIRNGLTTDDPGNIVFYSNPEVDQLLQEGRATADFDDRKAIYDEVQAITAEEVPIITLMYDLFGNVYDDTQVGPPPPGEPNSLGAIKPGYLYRV